MCAGERTDQDETMTMNAYHLHDSDSDDETTLPTEAQGLFQHRMRPQWGMAIVVWERGDKRAYQFQDGELRIFKQDFYGLFDEVDAPEEGASELVDELHRRLTSSVERGRQRKAVTKPLEALYPFDTQLEIMGVLYPEGFVGDVWQEEMRGEGTPRRLKRHRAAALVEGEALLSEEALKTALAEGTHGAIWEGCMALLAATNLLTTAQAAPLAKLEGPSQVAFVEALNDALWGEGSFDPRYETLQASLSEGDETVSWPLATALLALAQPTRHICVRPSTFRKQAGSIAPSLAYPSSPSSRGYRNFRRMATATQRRLEAAGLAPRDLMDVYDFMWMTLRPAAIQAIRH